MASSGEYGSRLRWLVCVRETDPDTGSVEESFVPSGWLWCSVEETSGRRQSEYNAPETGANADIRVRNFPALSALDILEDEDAGYYWKVDSIHNGDNELVCDCYRRDELVDFVIVEDSDSGGG